MDLNNRTFNNQTVLQDIHKRAIDEFSIKFNNKLVDYIRENLDQMGYSLYSPEEVYSFCRNRITRISQGDNHDLFLDYNGPKDNKFVGSYTSKINIDYFI